MAEHDGRHRAESDVQADPARADARDTGESGAERRAADTSSDQG